MNLSPSSASFSSSSSWSSSSDRATRERDRLFWLVPPLPVPFLHAWRSCFLRPRPRPRPFLPLPPIAPQENDIDFALRLRSQGMGGSTEEDIFRMERFVGCVLWVAFRESIVATRQDRLSHLRAYPGSGLGMALPALLLLEFFFVFFCKVTLSNDSPGSVTTIFERPCQEGFGCDGGA